MECRGRGALRKGRYLQLATEEGLGNGIVRKKRSRYEAEVFWSELVGWDSVEREIQSDPAGKSEGRKRCRRLRIYSSCL